MGRETNDAREKRTRARREVVSLAVIVAFPVSDLVHKPFIFVSVYRKMNLVRKIDERTTIRNRLKLKEISTLLKRFTVCLDYKDHESK